MSCWRRRRTPFACSRRAPWLLAAALVLTFPLTAQQTAPVDEAAVSELARILAAADSRTFDEAIFRDGLQQTDPSIRRQAAHLARLRQRQVLCVAENGERAEQAQVQCSIFSAPPHSAFPTPVPTRHR